MSLYQRGPIWWYEFVIRGNRYRKSTRVTTKREARAIEADDRARIEAQHAKGMRSLLLSEGLERYYSERLAPRSPRPETARKNVNLLEIILEHFGDVPLEDLTTPRMSQWTANMLKAGLRPATVNRRLSVVKSMLKRAFETWEVIEKVPRIDLVTTARNVERFITEPEYERLIDVSPEHLQRLIQFLAGTGARLGEATSLTWDNVTFNKGQRSFVRFPDTKSGVPRAVPLPRGVRDMLQEIQGERVDGESHVFVWTDAGGYRHPYVSPKSTWLKARKAAGLCHIRLHDLRHLFAARLVRRGVGLYQVSKLLGHASIVMTQRYASLRPEDLEEAVAVLD